MTLMRLGLASIRSQPNTASVAHLQPAWTSETLSCLVEIEQYFIVYFSTMSGVKDV